MVTKMFDVICVGAGPAGNLVSYLLVQQGFSVLLLEKDVHPRVKICGGGLTPKALSCIPYDISEVVHNHIHSARIVFGEENSFSIAVRNAGAVVERSQFDMFMTEKAKSLGVTFLDDVTISDIRQNDEIVSVATSKGNFQSKFLIGADGANSSVKRIIFPEKGDNDAFGIEALYSYQTSKYLSSNEVVFDFGAIEYGYGWLFPKRDHYNVGLYRIRKTSKTGSLKQRMASFVKRYPDLSGSIPGKQKGHPIPISTGKQKVGSGKVFLVGDAACLGEAFFGEGIAFALRSAHIASKYVADILLGKQVDGSYHKALLPLISELKFSLFMARGMYALPEWLLELLTRDKKSQGTMLIFCKGIFPISRDSGKWLSIRPV